MKKDNFTDLCSLHQDGACSEHTFDITKLMKNKSGDGRTNID
jgi:hypothetical protein